MPARANVFVYYGPYDSCGRVEHRIHRLEGLQTVLKKDGHRVNLVPISDRNAVELKVNGQNIFSCCLLDLDYGGDGQLDPLCADALEKVTKSF